MYVNRDVIIGDLSFSISFAVPLTSASGERLRRKTQSDSREEAETERVGLPLRRLRRRDVFSKSTGRRVAVLRHSGSYTTTATTTTHITYTPWTTCGKCAIHWSPERRDVSITTGVSQHTRIANLDNCTRDRPIDWSIDPSWLSFARTIEEKLENLRVVKRSDRPGAHRRELVVDFSNF